MILHSMTLSESLRRSLSLCHDHDQSPLVAATCGGGIEVTRAGGDEPSASEQHEVRARAVAHLTGEDETPTVRLRVTREGDVVIVTAEE